MRPTAPGDPSASGSTAALQLPVNYQTTPGQMPPPGYSSPAPIPGQAGTPSGTPHSSPSSVMLPRSIPGPMQSAAGPMNSYSQHMQASPQLMPPSVMRPPMVAGQWQAGIHPGTPCTPQGIQPHMQYNAVQRPHLPNMHGQYNAAQM
eukprot:gene29782-5245_t